jgi:hypothetical protein
MDIYTLNFYQEGDVHTFLISENSNMCAIEITIFHFSQTFLGRDIVLAGDFRILWTRALLGESLQYV